MNAPEVGDVWGNARSGYIILSVLNDTVILLDWYGSDRWGTTTSHSIDSVMEAFKRLK